MLALHMSGKRSLGTNKVAQLVHGQDFFVPLDDLFITYGGPIWARRWGYSKCFEWKEDKDIAVDQGGDDMDLAVLFCFLYSIFKMCILRHQPLKMIFLEWRSCPLVKGSIYTGRLIEAGGIAIS